MTETVRPQEEPQPEPPAEPGPGPAKKSYPGIALGIILLFFGLALIGGQNSDPGVANSAERTGFVIGWAFGGVILWGIAWLITIRHASRGWKWGSLLAIIAVGLLTGLVRLG